jgi:hypothetical protein
VTRMNTTNSGIVRTLRDNSFNRNITTPDKPMQNTSIYKNSSSNKKSSIKRYKPTDIAHNRIPRPALYELNSRRPQIHSRNTKMECKKPTKLDFGSKGQSFKVTSTSRSRKTLNPSTASYKKISQVKTFRNVLDIC